jgi:hypothetical protein
MDRAINAISRKCGEMRVEMEKGWSLARRVKRIPGNACKTGGVLLFRFPSKLPAGCVMNVEK